MAEIKRIHIQESVIDENKKIDPLKLDLVARLGEDWYTRVTKESLFTVEKPNTQLGIGIDQLPNCIKNNPDFSNNEKAQLANVNVMPVHELMNYAGKISRAVVLEIKSALEKNDTQQAWKIIETSILHQ